VTNGNRLIEARTADGVMLRLRHQPAQGPSRGAVLLLHGLSANDAVFRVPGRSFAGYLAEQGLDCYLANLRGAGPSDHPRRPWSLDDYVTKDLPALISAVQQASGRQELSWVGHSMGGILMYFHMLENPTSPITRGVSVGSSIDYKVGDSVYAELTRLLPLAGVLDFVPYGALTQLTARVAGSGPLFPPERMNFFRPNVDRQRLRHVLATGFHRIPVALFHSLATTFSAEGFSRDAGAVRYLELTQSYRLPTLFVGGDRDPQARPPSVQHTAELLGGHPDSRALIVGQSRGQSVGYGHFDLLMGERAPDDVWPALGQFLLS
jgi:pimeloyl-ACP methyl ester carboxylesterase